MLAPRIKNEEPRFGIYVVSGAASILSHGWRYLRVQRRSRHMYVAAETSHTTEGRSQVPPTRRSISVIPMHHRDQASNTSTTTTASTSGWLVLLSEGFSGEQDRKTTATNVSETWYGCCCSRSCQYDTGMIVPKTILWTRRFAPRASIAARCGCSGRKNRNVT